MDKEELIGEGVRFERIRRITGYLVSTLDRFNNAKRAEVNDRVKHMAGMPVDAFKSPDDRIIAGFALRPTEDSYAPLRIRFPRGVFNVCGEHQWHLWEMVKFHRQTAYPFPTGKSDQEHDV